MLFFSDQMGENALFTVHHEGDMQLGSILKTGQFTTIFFGRNNVANRKKVAFKRAYLEFCVF